MIRDFISLVFPVVCQSCGRALTRRENCLCLHCLYHLPQTRYHLYPDNPVCRLFWGRVPVFAASAMYTFVKGGQVQGLIHRLKYRGKKEIGQTLGRYYGTELLKSPSFASITGIVPVPLHSGKLRRRGYNQAEQFAEGMGASFGVPVFPRTLIRTEEGSTQTQKSKYDRWENIRNNFRIKEADPVRDQHILLVDDVVTTGATLEACAHKLLEIPGVKVSIAAIAFTANA